MEFLKQLLSSASSTPPEVPVEPHNFIEELKGADTSSFSSFISESVEKIKVDVPFKPRAKALNDALMSKKGGVIPSDKTDFCRAKEKQKTQNDLNDVTEAVVTVPNKAGVKRFQFTAWADGKAIGSGYVYAADAVDARKQAMLKTKGAQKVEVKELPEVPR